MVPESWVSEGFGGQVRANRFQRLRQFTRIRVRVGLCRKRGCRTENAGVGGSIPPLGTIAVTLCFGLRSRFAHGDAATIHHYDAVGERHGRARKELTTGLWSSFTRWGGIWHLGCQ